MSKTIKSLLLYIVFLAAVYAVTYHGYIYIYKVRADQAPPPQAYLHHYVHNEPYIDGPPEFQQDIKNALATIKEASPEQYEDVCKYCVQVKYVDVPTDNAGMAKHKTIFIFATGYEDALANLSFNEYRFESMIIHEAEHLIQYANNGSKIPIEQREAEALAAERKLLTALDVPPELIEQVAGEHLLETRWWEKDADIWNAMGRN